MTVVLDASALLAVLHNEVGADSVEAVLEDSAISTVNWAEVVQKETQHGVNVLELREGVESLGVRFRAFDVDAAEATAALHHGTRKFGLALGDRACLALALSLNCPAMTADRTWAKLDIGVPVKVIR
jgi:PIN domain nuclease of toxin-antitoxin system